MSSTQNSHAFLFYEQLTQIEHVPKNHICEWHTYQFDIIFVVLL